MSRKILSWLTGRSGNTKRPTPLALARLERRFRTEADDVRVGLPTGVGRRTLDALHEVDRGGVGALTPFPRSSLAMATMSLAAALVLAILIGQVLSTPESATYHPSISRAVTVPTPLSLQEDAIASLQVFESYTGLSLGRLDVSEPLLTEVKALWQDASRAADAILASMPSRKAAEPSTVRPAG